MTRRNFLESATALTLTASMSRAQPSSTPAPAGARLFTESGTFLLEQQRNRWTEPDIEVDLAPNGTLSLLCPKHQPTRLHLRWRYSLPASSLILGDAWERSYGDLAWRHFEPERILPWYFLANTGAATFAVGVQTGAAALCFWQADPAGISLWCDLRNGGRGVELGARKLEIAQIAWHTFAGLSPFEAARQFCRMLCPTPKIFKQPFYGGNNWYYAYGHSSASDIRGDSERIADLAPKSENRPWMVIDDGWQPNPTRGPWRSGNAQFPDMAQLAGDMQKIGVRPGIWIRPLFTKEDIPTPWRLSSPSAERELSAGATHTLDPTVPEALAHIQEDIETLSTWGYQLIKHDFSTYDLLGRWGSTMGAEPTSGDWHFADRSRTNAEIIRKFYGQLREAARDSLLLGCDTIGHLGAGIFEMQRIGDDTSGRNFDRTRKMGVNTLAFRLPQHNTFFAIDADCVGLTKEIDWKLNRQWLDLLARSGTPLFVSAAPDALGPEQRAALRDAFSLASKAQTAAEPLDWLITNQPAHWRTASGERRFDWYGSAGSNPFRD
jgi:alpha-galactosidase